MAIVGLANQNKKKKIKIINNREKLNMFGNQKIKDLEEKVKDLASAKRDIKILWDVCEPQINAKLEQGMQEVVTACKNI